MSHETSIEELETSFFKNKNNIVSKEKTESERIVICYNPKCPDYHKERPYDVACGCKIKRVTGAGR